MQVVTRLYREWDAASRSGATDLALRLEQDMCAHLTRLGGSITIGRDTFTVFPVLQGRQKSFYFRCSTIYEAQGPEGDGSGGYSFDRMDQHVTQTHEGETPFGEFKRKMSTRGAV